MPPRSRLWAKQRSTISARSLKASRATPDLSRARLLVTARRAASSPYHSKVVWKRPGDGGFAWHQDYGYWYENGCLFPDMASCSIAIDKADPMRSPLISPASAISTRTQLKTAAWTSWGRRVRLRENACLQVVKGSHRLGRVGHVQVAGQATVEPERLTEILKVLEVAYCEMDPGDAVFTHCNVIHRSDANRSERSRHVLICCYNAAANDPYKEHHHPRYTPLAKVPDGAIKEAGRRLSQPDKVFLTAEGVEHTHATFE